MKSCVKVPQYLLIILPTIGDVALMELKSHPNGLPGLAQVAIQQGKHF